VAVPIHPAPDPSLQAAHEPQTAGGLDGAGALWTVTVDHGGALLDDELDANVVDQLVGKLAGQVVAVSHHPRRFTTTVRLRSPDALAAADLAARLVRDAADEVGLPAWPLVHLEVVLRD
jgi:hypothetical protein